MTKTGKLGLALLLAVPLVSAPLRAKEAETDPGSAKSVEPAPGVVAYFHDRLIALGERLAARPSADALAKQGISVDNDVYERSLVLGSQLKGAEAGVVPPSIGRAGPVRDVAWIDMAADPTLVLGAVNALRVEFGRDPSELEIAAELQTFDAKIALVNARLADARESRAEAYRKTGRISQEMEEQALESFLVAGTTLAPHDGNRQATNDPEFLDQRIAWLTQQMNLAAAAAGDASSKVDVQEVSK